MVFRKSCWQCLAAIIVICANGQKKKSLSYSQLDISGKSPSLDLLQNIHGLQKIMPEMSSRIVELQRSSHIVEPLFLLCSSLLINNLRDLSACMCLFLI
jgi:hypothetical protein